MKLSRVSCEASYDGRRLAMVRMGDEEFLRRINEIQFADVEIDDRVELLTELAKVVNLDGAYIDMPVGYIDYENQKKFEVIEVEWDTAAYDRDGVVSFGMTLKGRDDDNTYRVEISNLKRGDVEFEPGRESVYSKMYITCQGGRKDYDVKVNGQAYEYKTSELKPDPLEAPEPHRIIFRFGR